MKRPGTALALALASVIVSPLLTVVEFIGLMILARAIYGPEYSLAAKALSVAVLVTLGLLAVALPVIAGVLGARARTESRAAGTGGLRLGTSAVVIAGIVIIGVAVAQVYVILLGTGICQLDGC